MVRQRKLTLLPLLLGALALPPAQAKDCGAYAAELATMAQADKAVRGWIDRLAPPEDRVAARRLDQAALVERVNLARFASLLAACGWPRRSVDGEPALAQAWALARQGRADLRLQKLVVRHLEAAVVAGEAPGRHLAVAADGVAVMEKRPQPYGTQLRPAGTCVWEFYPLDSHVQVEERRTALGLPPLDEQQRFASDIVIHENCPNPRLTVPPMNI